MDKRTKKRISNNQTFLNALEGLLNNEAIHTPPKVKEEPGKPFQRHQPRAQLKVQAYYSHSSQREFYKWS